MATNNATNTSNPITVAQGGTGDSSLTAYAVLCGGTTSTAAVQSIAGVGSSGQVLTSTGAGSLPTFQNGGLVLIGASDASSSTNIPFTGLTTYSSMIVIIRGLLPATSGSTLNMLVSTDGVTYATSGYVSGINTHTYNSATLANANTTASVRLSTALNNPVSFGYCCNLVVKQLNVAAPVIVNGQAMYYDNSSISQIAEIGAYCPQSITAVRFEMSSGNITSGHFALYGLVSS